MGQKHFDLLIVDDDPDILRLLEEAFRDSSLRVQTANSLTEARTRLAQHGYSVVLSDHNLPDGNGVDFLAAMPAAGVRAVPILMTGMTDLSVAADAINRGKVYRFVTKPLDLMVVEQAVHRALELRVAESHREQLTHEIVEHNRRLRHEAEAKERSLRTALEQIRAEQAKIQAQQEQIGQLYQEIQAAYLHTVTSLTAAIEAKDRYTKGHSERVFYYCSLMADVLGLPETSRSNLHFASILHDLGKIGIPDSILLKPGRLTDDEVRVMASHLALTDEILRPLPFLEPVRTIIRGHHERFDGTGYPDRVKGDENCLEGRILAVADAFDAMRSTRPYRKALTRERAVAELKSGAGSQFCPLCVGALLYGLESKGEFVSNGADETTDLRGLEEESLRIRPASESIRVPAEMN